MAILSFGLHSLALWDGDSHMFIRNPSSLSGLPCACLLCYSAFDLLLSRILVHGDSAPLLIAALLPYMLVVASVAFA